MSPKPKSPKPRDDRVVVNMSADHPELLADLAALPRRARAARLRHLAAVGLAAIRAGGITVPLAHSPSPPATTPDAADSRRRDRLVGRLGRVDE